MQLLWARLGKPPTKFRHLVASASHGQFVRDLNFAPSWHCPKKPNLDGVGCFGRVAGKRCHISPTLAYPMREKARSLPASEEPHLRRQGTGHFAAVGEKSGRVDVVVHGVRVMAAGDVVKPRAQRPEETERRDVLLQGHVQREE